MSLQYSKFQNEDGRGNVTLFYDGAVFTATSSHPNWDSIVVALEANDSNVVYLFDVSKTVAKKFESLSERISVRDGRVFLDGDEVNNALTGQIVRFLDQGHGFRPLVRFYERLTQNPNQESVEQLYRWLNTHDFTITDEGKIVGYKGVERTRDGYQSVHSGTAIVNGEEVTGQIPNAVGDVIEMPRSAVTFDPAQGCSTGLHVGTFAYAKGWGNVLLKVLVDPRDVVSVPTDSSDAKLRTCRYVVVDVINAPLETAVDSYDYDDFDDGGWNVECDCGEYFGCSC